MTWQLDFDFLLVQLFWMMKDFSSLILILICSTAWHLTTKTKRVRVFYP